MWSQAQCTRLRVPGPIVIGHRLLVSADMGKKRFMESFPDSELCDPCGRPTNTGDIP
jgi:hypothetical protein